MNDRTLWMEEASCLELPTRDLDRLFFADSRAPGKERREEQAKALCDSCPVSLECFLYNADDPVAIVAGMTAEERGTAA